MTMRTQAKPVPLVAPMLGASSREMLVAAGAIVGFVIALVIAAQASYLIVRNLWLDEICTYLLVNDPSLAHMFDALLHGADSNVPGLYLILRGIRGLGIPINEVTLRLFSGACGVLALTGIYGCLRFVFDRISSALAVVTLFSGYLLISQFFEGRFYAPWFAICAWFCYCLAVIRLRPRAIEAQIALAVLTVLMLSIHYFGVFSFVAIAAGDWLTERQPFRRRWARRWPLLFAVPMIGVIAFFYGPQKRALTVPTWIEDPTVPGVYDFLKQTLALTPMAILAALAGICWVGKRFWKFMYRGDVVSIRPVAGLTALAAVPVIEVVFSYAKQPAMVDRYGLPGLGGAAVALAWLYSRLNRTIAVGAALCFVAFSGYRFHSAANEQLLANEEIGYYASVLEKAPPGELILCERRHDLYPMVLYFPELKGRIFLLDFETSEESAETLAPSMRYNIVERDANRAVVQSYPQMQLYPKRRLSKGLTFLLVASDGNEKRLEERFPGAKVMHVSYRIFEITMAG